MLGLPWWAWVVLVVVAVFLYGRRAARGWRAAFRSQFIAYLKREAPEFEVVAEGDYELEVKGQKDASGTLRLDKLFAQGTQIGAGDVAARDALFAHFVKMLREGKSMDALDAERDRARVMPRVVADAFLEGLRADGLRNSARRCRRSRPVCPACPSCSCSTARRPSLI